MKVFLDDERSAPKGWILVKTAEDALSLLAMRGVSEISLDHDLGGIRNYESTGYTVLLWIERMVALDKTYIPPKIYIHTANSSARVKMELGVKSIERLVSERK